MRNILFFLLAALFFSACSDEKKLQRIEKRSPELFQTRVRDSVGKPTITYIQRDSTINVPGHTDTFTVSVPCPPTMAYTHTSHFKTGTAILHIDSGKATVICHDDSLSEIISWQNEIIDSNRTYIREGLAERMVAQPPTSFDDFCHWFTILALLCVALYFGGKYLPTLLKVIKGGL